MNRASFIKSLLALPAMLPFTDKINLLDLERIESEDIILIVDPKRINMHDLCRIKLEGGPIPIVRFSSPAWGDKSLAPIQIINITKARETKEEH